MNAAGVMVFGPTGRVLLLRRSRSDESHPGLFDLPGGGAEDGESFGDCARRECVEETGWSPPEMVEVSRVSCTDGDGEYAAHVSHSPVEFEPRLSEEHTWFKWSNTSLSPGELRELHPGLADLLSRIRVHR